MYFKIVFVLVSILMIAGGAVNSGATSFWLATPFMLYLVYVSYRYKKLLVLPVFLYIFVAIYISQHRDTNPYLYPILKNGEVTILTDGFSLNKGKMITTEKFLKTFKDEVPDSEKLAFDDFINNPNIRKGTFHISEYYGDNVSLVQKAFKGDTFKVLAIQHDHIEFADQIDVRTEFAYFDGIQYVSPDKYKYVFNKELQSGWSQLLGGLMYFILWPLYLMYISVPYLLYRAFMFFKNRVVIGNEL